MLLVSSPVVVPEPSTPASPLSVLPAGSPLCPALSASLELPVLEVSVELVEPVLLVVWVVSKVSRPQAASDAASMKMRG